MKTKTRWGDFITDVGDSIGGFLIGFGVCAPSPISAGIGIAMIVTSIYLEYYKKGKEDGEQISKVG